MYVRVHLCLTYALIPDCSRQPLPLYPVPVEIASKGLRVENSF